MVAERDGLAGLGGLGHVGVGVDEVVGAGVLREERQHRAGALGPGGHVVLLEGGVAAPVHDGVEVQVEDRLARGGQAGADHLLVQGGQEPLLVGVGEPVGVVGERGLLRQHGEPGEQRGGGIGEQVIDVGDPPGAGELEGQQGQQPAGRGDDAGAGVAGRGGQGGQVQGGQVGNGQQQPGPGRVQPLRPGAEVDDLRRGQGGVPAGGGRAEMLASGSGRRSSRPNPSSARISATEVRFSGVPSAASRAEIS